MAPVAWTNADLLSIAQSSMKLEKNTDIFVMETNAFENVVC